MDGYIFTDKVFKNPIILDLELQYSYPFRVLFLGLLTHCDSKGKFVWDLEKLKRKILPYNESSNINFEESLNILRIYEIVIQYSANGQKLGYVKAYSNYVTRPREAPPSILPNPVKRNRLSEEEIEVLFAKKYLPKNCPSQGLDLDLRSQINTDPIRLLTHNDLRSIYNIIYNNITNKEKEKKEKKLKQKKEEKEKEKLSTARERFEKFWSAYPRKVEKQKCLEIFRKMKIDDELLEKMLGALRDQLAERELMQKHQAFVPEFIYPIRWLSRKRWEDQVELDERVWSKAAQVQNRDPNANRPQPAMFVPTDHIVDKPVSSTEAAQNLAKIKKMLNGTLKKD